MKTPTLARESSKTKKKNNQIYATIITGIVVVGGLLFIGGLIERSRYEEPLQGNQACKEAMAAQSRQLLADSNAVFGIPKPDGTPSAAQVIDLQKKCDETFEVYTVTVEAK